MRREVALAVAAGTGMISVRAEAATTQLDGLIDVHAGYGNNPLFSLQSLGGSPTVGVSATATLSRVTSRSRTEITGEGDYDNYLKHYGNITNYSARLRHNQQLSQFFALSGTASYYNSINQSPNYSVKSTDINPLTDLLTVGQRTRRFTGSLDATWEPNDRNLFQGGINGSHATFSGGPANAYDQYGASVGYLRTINAHTKIGFQGGITKIMQTGQPHAKSYTGGLQLVQDLGPRWHLEAGVSLLAQTNFGRLVKTPGFNLTLCGKYTRRTICFFGSRLSSPSGLGGLRTDTQGGVRVNQTLTARSRIEIEATYDISKGTGAVAGTPTQKYLDASIAYHHDIGRRIVAGAVVRGQSRDYSTLFAGTTNGASKVNVYTTTINVAWKFGRNN